METKFKLLEEVYYADFVALTLQKSKVVGMVMQKEDLPMVYYLDNGLTVDENNLYKTVEEGKNYLTNLFEGFKSNLDKQEE